MPYVYVIHFHGNVCGKARHYTGFSWNREHMEKRISQHRRGVGAKFTQLANFKGIGWQVVRIFRTADPYDEIRVKRHAKLLCPICGNYATVGLAFPGNAALDQAAD
jgi:predicted GIY-YIG superfamily endonuclease